MKHPDMERREFLKKAGLSAIALAASQGLSPGLATPVLAHDGGRTGFIFAALNTGGIDGEGVNHMLFMTGEGTFGKHDVHGGGSYIHFDLNSPGFPKNLLETGTWRAERLLKWTKVDHPDIPYGQIISGILELTATLFPAGGPQRGVPGQLAVI